MTKPEKRYLEAEITVMKGFAGQEYPITSAIGEPLTLPELLAKEYPDLREMIVKSAQTFIYDNTYEFGSEYVIKHRKSAERLADAIITLLKGEK